MNAYFLEIAVVRLSAKLLGKELIDNYAFHGSLPRFSSLTLKGVGEAEGLEKVPEKAADFNFGAACGRAIEKVLGKLSEKESLFVNAEIARNLFLDSNPEKRAPYTEAEIHSALRVIFLAMIKKSQIRTHTAKPGEDINTWLAGYYELEKNHNAYVTSLAAEIVSPDGETAKKFPSFFDRTDPLIALALGKDVNAAALKAASLAAPKSMFGKILLETLNQAG